MKDTTGSIKNDLITEYRDVAGEAIQRSRSMKDLWGPLGLRDKLLGHVPMMHRVVCLRVS